jgi:hypothetical protein
LEQRVESASHGVYNPRCYYSNVDSEKKKADAAAGGKIELHNIQVNVYAIVEEVKKEHDQRYALYRKEAPEKFVVEGVKATVQDIGVNSLLWTEKSPFAGRR